MAVSKGMKVDPSSGVMDLQKSAAKGNEQRSWQRSVFLFEASYQCSVELEDKFLSSMDGSLS